MKKLLLALSLLFASCAVADAQLINSFPYSIPPCVIGTNFRFPVNYQAAANWPKLPLCTSRLWDTSGDTTTANFTMWSFVETARGVYNWTYLDSQVAWYQAHNLRITYTFGSVPGWANSNAGGAVPPTTFQDFYDYVTAVVSRYGAQISDYECWNEPFSTTFWTGTNSQLQTLCQGAYAAAKTANPNVVFFSPSWLPGAEQTAFLNGCTAGCVDGLNFHAYGNLLSGSGNNTQYAPEQNWNMFLETEQAGLAAGYTTQPYTVNEGGILVSGTNYATADVEQQAGAAIWAALCASSGFIYCDWFQYDGATNSVVNLINPNGVSLKKGFSGPGYALSRMIAWLQGTMTSPVMHQYGSNLIRNTSQSGAVVGTPGTLPTNMTCNGDCNSHGINYAVVSTGSETGKDESGQTITVNEVCIRVNGTPTAGASGFTQFIFESPTQIVATFNQQHTFGVYLKLTAGSMTNVPDFLVSTQQYTSGGGFLASGMHISALNISGIPIYQQHYMYFSYEDNASVGRVDDFVSVRNNVGSPIDLTFCEGNPTDDTDTFWTGNITEPNGSLAQIVWNSDVVNGAKNYTVPGGYNYCRTLDDSVCTVSGGVIAMADHRPILLENAPRASFWPL